MPKISFPNEGIVIPIEEAFIVGSKSYQRKIFVRALREDFEKKQVFVDMVMRFYINDVEERVSKLVTPVFTTIAATNAELCDVNTGQVLCFTKDEFISVPVEQEVTTEEPVYDPVSGEQTGTNTVTSTQIVLEQRLNPALLNEDQSEKVYAPQFDWFFNLGETQEINVHNLIKSFVLEAFNTGAFN